jgi:hypothetical protein
VVIELEILEGRETFNALLIKKALNNL